MDITTGLSLLDRNRRQIELVSAVRLLLFAGCVISPAVAYTGNYSVADLMFFCCCVGGLAITMCFNKVWRQAPSRLCAQMALCLALPALYVPLALIYTESKDAETILRASLLCLVLGTEIVLWLWFVAARRQKNAKAIVKLRNVVRANRWIIVLCVAVFLICLEDLHRGVKWDSGHYYKGLIGVDQLSFSSADILQFKKAGHICYAFSFFYYIGYMLLPTNHVLGVRLVTVLMYLAAVVAFYGIIKLLFPKVTSGRIALLTALFAFTPSILGPIHEINLEVISLASFTLLVWAYLSDFQILQFLFSMTFVFSKESNVLLLFAFFVGDFVLCWIKGGNGNLSPKGAVIRLSELLKADGIRLVSIYYLPCTAFLAHFVFDAASWGSGATGVERSSQLDYLNSFGINKVNIISKIEEIFFMNFGWIVCLAIVLFGIIAILKHSNGHPSQVLLRLVPVFISGVVFLLFNLLYITYVFPRYVILGSFFLTLLLSVVCLLCPVRAALINISCSVIAALLLIQTFKTIDPITRCMFRNIDVGGRTIISTSNIIAYSANNYEVETYAPRTQAMMLSPYAYYNREWGYYDDLLDRCLDTINYKEGDLLVFPDAFSPISIGPFFGWCENSYYDAERSHIVQRYGNDLDYDGMEKISFRFVSPDWPLDNIGSFDRVYVFYFPFTRDYDYESSLGAYSPTRVYEVGYRGWNAVILEVEGGA